MIITGLDESTAITRDDGSHATTDEEKIYYLLDKIGEGHVEINNIQRLGTQEGRGTTRHRPVKVTLKNSTQRIQLLRNASKLKALQGPLAKVFIRKDQHPAIQREISRIRKTAYDEKKKTENSGKNVRIDWKTRCVYVNDLIIDSFQPTFS